MNSRRLRMNRTSKLAVLTVALCGCLAVSTQAAEPNSNAPPHWSFAPVKLVSPPTVSHESWVRTPVDCFVLAKLEAAGLGPAAEANKRTLIRRAMLDMWGLPPTPEEVAAFEADQSPDAFERLIDRLLGSPMYGERWGRHWLDVARYADTAGDNADYPVPEARFYRDYVIDAFNHDKPYNTFVVEQLAGDIVAKKNPANEYAEHVIATGFVALSRRYATAPFELMHLTVEDAIETTSRAFMGLSFRCARCHDHKFDPVSMEDYYAIYGFFESTQFPYAGSEEFQSKKFDRSGFQPLVPAAVAEPQVASWRDRAAALDAEIKRLEQLTQATDDDKKQLESVREQRRKLTRAGLPLDMASAYAVCDAKPVNTALHTAGEPHQRGAVIHRGLPKSLAAGAVINIPEGTSGRLEFANWLTSPSNPLTARVMVNRIWQHHFGRGIVTTPSNFGLRGDPPSHPELLDYLATRFVASGWSVKEMHRQMMLSATYRQSSSIPEPDPQTMDPDNRLLSHYSIRRLEAEAIRDAMMSLAGTLDLRRPVLHPFPEIGQWQWTQHNPFKSVYESNHRSVYLMTQRIQRHPYLALFDSPDTNTSTDVRTQATVPLQALYLMNNRFVADQASGFAKKLIAESDTDEARVSRAIQSAWCRPGDADEATKAVAFLRRYKASLSESGVENSQAEIEAWTSYARILLTANEFFYVD